MEPGFAWDVHLTTARDGDACNAEPVTYDETLRYVLRFDEAQVRLALDEDDFARGMQAGCDLTYQSVVWSEVRDGHTLRWQIDGEAQFRTSGSACDIVGDVDWRGTETFTVVASEHPDVPGGCTYTVDAVGSYVGDWP